MSTLKAEDGDASERELLVDDIQRIREVLHISGGADKLSSDEEGDEESEEEEEDERENGGESLIGSTSNNSQHQIASHLSPPNSQITIPGTVLRAGDVEEQSPLNTRQEHASAPAGNNAQQQRPDVVLLQQQADNNFLPPSNVSSDECTLTELQPVNCQPSTSVFSPGIPIASMSSLNVLNSVTNVTFISDPSTISVGYNDTTWLTEADQYCGQNDVDEQGEEGGLFSEGDDENYEDIETRSQIQQCLSKNRDYQLAVLDELGRLELALAKNREKKLGLHQMRASKDEGRPEPHTLIKFGNPYFKDTGAVGPPDNIDSKLKRQNCQVGGYQSKQKSWNAKEKACLADGVKMQNLENKLSPVLQKIQKLELNKNKTNIDCQELEVLKTESSRIKNIPKEKLAYDLEGIDWDRISNTYVPKRAGFQCRLQWCNFGHPDVNCTPWTKDEDKKLIQLAKNPQNTWVTIAQNLQTKRTPIHCYERYQRSLNKDLLKSKWTPEDDQLLLEVVRDVGLGNWPRVASFLEGRQGDQCMHRYTQTLQMVRKGKWTTDEDELLKKGIEKYGTAWNKVSDMVPGRSGPQCRERWVNALDPKIDKGVWTKGQDKNLLDNVEKFGKGNWSKIARAMGNRTDNQCWRRWIVLRKDDFLYYRQNTLRKKRELVSNFTGRRQERPSLEPEDLDIPDVPVVKKQRGRVPLPPEVSRERRRLTRKKFREKKRAEKRRAEEEARENTSREKQQVQRNETNENREEELEGVEDGDKETVEEVKSPQNRKARGNRTRVQQPHRMLINNKQLPKRQRVTEKQDKRHTEPAGGQKTVTVSGSLGPFSLLLQAFSIDIPTVLRAIQTTSTTSSTTPPSSGTNVIPGDQQQMQTSSAAGNQESQQTSSTTPPSSGTNAILGDQQQMQTSSAAENEEIPQTSSTTPPSSGTNVTPGDQQQVQTSGATGNQESPQTSSTTLPSSGTNVTPGDQQQMQTSSAAGNQESQQTSSTTLPSSGTNVTPGDQQQMQTSSAAGNQESPQTSSTTPPSSGTNAILGDQQQMQTSSAAENHESPQTSSTTPLSSGTNVTPGDQQQMQTSSAAGNQDSQQTSYTTPVSSGTNIIPEDQQQMQTSSAAETPESQQMQTEVSGDSAASQSSVNTEAGARDDTSESQEKQERAKASSGQDSQLLKEKVDESGGDQVTKHKNTGQTVGLQSRSEVNNSETLNTSRVEAGNKSTAGTPTSVAASTTNQAPRRRATAIPPLPPCFTTLRTFKSLLQLRPQLQRIAAMLNPTPCCSTAGSQSHQSLSAACPVVSSGSLSNKMSGVTCEPRDESRDSNVASRKDSEAMNKSRDNETTLGEYHVVSPGYTRDIQPCTVVEAGKENENVITDNRLSTAGTQLAEHGLPITNDKTGPEQAKATEATLSSTISSAQDGGVTDDRFSTGFAPMPKEGLQVPANDKTGPWKAKPSEPAGSVSVGNDKQAATKTNRERDTNSPSTYVANNSRVPPAVKETRSYRNSYEYKMLSSRFSGLFLWPALLSKIPVKFTSTIGPAFVQRHPPPTTRPAPEVTEKNATRKRKNTKPIEAPRPKRKHPGLAAVRMATSASSATPAQQMCTVGQGSAIRKEAAVAAAQPDADPLLATSQLVSLSTSSTGKRRYNTRASKRKGVPAKRRIKVIESSSSSSEDDWSEVYGRQRREPIITQTARITRQTSAVKPTKVSRAISAKLTSTTATDQVGANQVASLSVIVISSDSTNESRPSLQDAQDDTAGLQSGAAANLNLSPKRSSNSNRSSKRKNPAPKKNRGARWRAMLPKVSAEESDSY